MNGRRIEQQTEEVPFEAVSFTCEVSDEALEAVGGKIGGGQTWFTWCPHYCGQH